MTGWLRRRRRARILAQPWPDAWDRYIDDNVALARRLDPARRQRLRELVQVFVAEKHWEGCGGLELTEEMQVTIAAQACVLVLGRDDELFGDVLSILVYPSTVVTPVRRLGFFEQPRAPVGHGSTIIGEAMLGGPVVLAWDAVLAGGREEIAGNVVLHELAHKLDMASGRIDGTPPLRTKAERERWARVCTAAYNRQRAFVDAGWPTLLDPYAATNEAEFFAVATEAYFTRPYELAWEYPEVFRLLADFYRQPVTG
jgi:Mlc titration factor MtfA (ptsG expression regulator)